MFRRPCILFIFCISQIALATTYKLGCDSSGHLTSVQPANEQVSDYSKTQMQNGVDIINNVNPAKSCATKLPTYKGPPGSLAIITDANSPMRNLTTRLANPNTWFDQAQIANIVRLSIANGTDPYLAVAISILENPPYHGREYSKDFASAFKNIVGGSLNHQAVTQALGCRTTDKHSNIGEGKLISAAEVEKYKQLASSNQSEEGSSALYKYEEQMGPQKTRMLRCATSDECLGGLAPPAHEVALDIREGRNEKTTTLYMCAGAQVWTANMSSFDIYKIKPHDECCAEVLVNSETANAKNAEDLLNIKIRPAIFIQVINNKMNNASKKIFSEDLVAEFAHRAQSYEGYGQFPQQTTSRCASGIFMGKSPLYGAYVGDLITNSLFANPELNEMIEQTAIQLGKPISNSFCKIKPEQSSMTVDSQSFLDLEKKYISDDGKNQSRMSECEKGTPKINFEAWSETEMKKFNGLGK